MRLYKAMKGTVKNPLSPHGNIKWKIGEWYKIKGNLSICNNGFHASKNIIDAMSYVTMSVLAIVEVRGESIKQSDKECWSEMRIVNTYRWCKKDSVALSIFVAELVIKNYENMYPDDKRPRCAIEAAKSYLKNPCNKTKSAASAAWSEAWSAASEAWSAAWSAESAARSEAWSAASAAKSAAWSAASAESAAASAAWCAASAASAAIEKCHSKVLEILNIKDTPANVQEHGDTE